MSGRPRQLLPGLCSSPEQRIMAPKLTWLLEADRWAGGARGYAGLSITVASDASWCARTSIGSVEAGRQCSPARRR